MESRWSRTWSNTNNPESKIPAVGGLPLKRVNMVLSYSASGVALQTPRSELKIKS
ncbi:MAG: hypothetical protein LBT05_11560 [Planctomycetaceae bacterium]|nr:hypothetical protein [Planctomycetaceae bacterium]